MPVSFYAHKPTPEHLDLFEKFKQLLATEVSIYCNPQHSAGVCVRNNAVIVSFGKVASNAVETSIIDKGCVGVRHLVLAHPNDLVRDGGKKEARAEAMVKLTELRDFLKANVFQPIVNTITEDDLPVLTAQQILLLKDITERGTLDGVCFQVAKNGKIIEIGCEKKKVAALRYAAEGATGDDTSADSQPKRASIFLTFSELFAIRNIMDILQVKQVTLTENERNP